MIRVAPRDWLEPQQRALLDARPRVSVPTDMDSQHLYERFMINLEYPAFRVEPLAGPNHHQLPHQLEERLTQANGHPDLSLVQPYAIGVVLRLVDLFDEVEKRVVDIMKATSPFYIKTQLSMCGLLPISAVSSASYNQGDFTIFLAALDALQELDLLLDVLQDQSPKPHPHAYICGSVRHPYHLIPDGGQAVGFNKTQLSHPIAVALTIAQYRQSTNFLDFDPSNYTINPSWLNVNNRALCIRFDGVEDPEGLVHPARRIGSIAQRLDAFRLYESVCIPELFLPPPQSSEQPVTLLSAHQGPPSITGHGTWH